MCSLGNEEDALTLLIPKENMPIGTTCIKCRQARSIIVLRSKDAYCKECFIIGTMHKFKSLLGKHKLIKPNDKVLVIFDGSESATSMLHFIRCGLDLTSPKRLKFESIVIYIERDENTSNLTLEARKSIFKELAQAVGQQKFDLHFTSYADYKANSLCLRIFKNYTDYLERQRVPSDKHNTDYDERLCLSNSNLMEQHIIRDHYIGLSVELECRFCFTPELAMDAAKTIISNIAFGRGGLLSVEVGTIDNRDARITIVRPMRLLDLQEVKFYNRIAELKTVDLRHCSKNTCTYDSIQNIVNDFVENLQENYPATVNTVVRTCDKLGISEGVWKNDVCKLCKCPIEHALGNLSSNEAIEFSHIASTQSNISIEGECSYQDYPKYYCFSCRKIS